MTVSGSIGVIGGMGPHAGLDLVDKITQQTRATSDQEHLSVVLLSYPDRIPDRSRYLADASQPDPVPPLVEIVREMGRIGVTVAGMPCVTAHNRKIFNRMLQILDDENCPTRVVSMIDTTTSFIRDHYPEVRRVAAISTTATFEAELFFPSLRSAGLNIVKHSDPIQEGVQQAIFNRDYGIKAVSHPVHPTARQLLVDSINYLRDAGADAVILGCTELPLGLPEKTLNGVTLIDPTLALARSLIQSVSPGKLGPIVEG